MLRKMLVYLVTIFMLFAGLATPVHADASSQLSADKTVIEPGKEVTVTFRTTKSLPGVGAYFGSLEINENFELSSASFAAASEIPGCDLMDKNTANGEVYFSYISSDGMTFSPGTTVFTAKLKAKDNIAPGSYDFDNSFLIN